MVVLVTGGTGFVGTHVCKRLAAEGLDVVTYDVVASSGLAELVLTPEEQARITVETGDLRDLPRMLKIARSYKIDGIVHLGYMITQPTLGNYWLAQSVNIEGTNNVFEFALTLGVKVVWASTIDVFGTRSVSAGGSVANDAPYDPQGIYGACKLLNEVAAREYARAHGLKTIALRIPASFGPGVTQSWVRFVPQMIKDFVDGRSARKPPVKNVMPWLYIEDIAEAFARALHLDEHEDVLGYTLPGSDLASDQVIRMICDMFPGKPTEDVAWREFGSMPHFDGTRVQTLLDWKPRYGIETGLQRIRDYYDRAKNGLAPPAFNFSPAAR